MTPRLREQIGSTAKLVGADATTTISEVTRLIADKAAYCQMADATNPYGDGQAALRTVNVLNSFLGQ